MPEKPPRSTSKFRGVSFNNQLKKWKAVITVGRSQHFLGYFAEELQAAKAYDEASLKHRGPQAPVNFPSQPSADAEGDAMDVSMNDAFTEGTATSLTNLIGMGGTVDSVESVRDAKIELEAIKATLAMQRGHQQQQQPQVPEMFMSL